MRIDRAVANMNELFNALLDISKLDAGAMNANISAFPLNGVLQHIEATFASAAREKGLRLRVVPCGIGVRSDPILLERILLNLVSNAVRYTRLGGVVVGARRMGDRLRIDVCDSGIGIPKDQQRSVFGEFYRISATEQERGDGLGLGLAIVERLCALLDHPMTLTSTPDRGSRFSVSVPIAPAVADLPRPPAAMATMPDPLHGKLIVVIDDDALVLDGASGLLRSWGCRVVTAGSDGEALLKLDRNAPDLIVSDFRLKDGRTGIEAIAAVRDAFRAPIPAFLISGDISPERLSQAQASGHHLLHKPVSPMALRAMMSRLLKEWANA
jgi:CheY-like chemotaxis protein